MSVVPRQEALRGHAAMLLFSALVAGSFSLGARAANLIDPTAISALRFVIAAGLIGGIALVGPGIPRSAFQAPWRYLLIGGIFSSYFVLMFEGLKTAKPVPASAVFTLTPLIAAGFGWLIMRQRMDRRMSLAMLLGAVGALWVIFRGDLGAMLRLELGRGELVYLLGCVAHALYIPLVRRFNRGENSVVFTFGMLVAGSVVLLLWGQGAIRATDWANLPLIVWVTVFYVSVFASAATFVLTQYASMRLPAAKVMAYTYLTPVWVITLEAILGQGLPGIVVLPGVAVTLIALWLLLDADE